MGLRGKKYTVENMGTVSDVQKNVEELAGLAVSKQGVLFGGKKLKSSDILEDVGIEDGSVINIVPSTNTKKKKSSSSTSSATTPASASSSDSESAGGAGGTLGGNSMLEGMEKMLESAGIDKKEIQEMFGSSPDGQPDMMKSMQMMQKMMSSPIFKEYISDPENLEKSRQMILQNPMMKGMMASLPGFDEIINDKEKWRETMLAAVSMYQNMGRDMMNAMAGMSGMGGLEGMGGMGGGPGAFGLPDGAGAEASAFAGLDELSEADM